MTLSLSIFYIDDDNLPDTIYICPDGLEVSNHSLCTTSTTSISTTSTLDLKINAPETTILPLKKYYARVGEKLMSGEILVYVSRIERKKGYPSINYLGEETWEGTPEGMDYIYAYASQTYTGNDKKYLGYDSFTLTDNIRKNYEVDFLKRVDNMMKNKLLYPGQSTEGYFIFTIPENSTMVRLFYDFQGLGGDIDVAVWVVPGDLS